MTSSSTQTLDNSKQIIQLLQKQIKQQAQVIAMLQEQTQTYKAQAQMIAHLQNKVDQFEVFHNRIRNFYCEVLSLDDLMLSASS
ncbi:8753_t:CDS:1, partial [Cetraspora pellucida]